MSNWCDVTQRVPVADGNFQQVLTFYLFECPVTIEKQPVSARGVSLESRGWQGPALRTLLAKMRRRASGNLKFLAVPPGTDVGEAVRNEEAASPLTDPRFELIAFREDARLGKTRTILYMIRNALAHGSFCVERTESGTVYWFDSAKNGNVRARIRLREETLLSWIELIRAPAPVGKRSRKVPVH